MQPHILSKCFSISYQPVHFPERIQGCQEALSMELQREQMKKLKQKYSWNY